MYSPKKLATALLGAALFGIGSAASAAVIVTGDGARSPFGGFDWAQNGSAVTTGFAPVTGTNLTTTYWANAIAVNAESGGVLSTPNLFPFNAAGTYEYTVLANITETVTCLNASCSQAQFTATGGTFNIYYDTSPDSNLVSGSGITDGTLLISGDINAGPAGVFIAGAGGTSGTGVFEFTGDVLFTNTTYINPALLSTNAVATLQFGTSTTNWVPPTGLPGGGGIPAGALVFQADGNQAFEPGFIVPEPGTLALGGLGLLLAAAGRRRRA
jgi:hypothetical protein